MAVNADEDRLPNPQKDCKMKCGQRLLLEHFYAPEFKELMRHRLDCNFERAGEILCEVSARVGLVLAS